VSIGNSICKSRRELNGVFKNAKAYSVFGRRAISMGSRYVTKLPSCVIATRDKMLH
jgi:hypothetical protein